MNLSQKIEKDYLVAYKAKLDDQVAVLRMLKTAIKNKQVELLRAPTDDEVLAIIGKQVKQRQESVEMFRKGGREELAAKEEREMHILKGYLPQALSPEELGQAVDAAIVAVGAKTPADLGKVIQAVMAEHRGRVDGKELSALVRSRLTS